VLNQKTDFKFNLMVVDNFSTDGTRDAIDEFKDDPRLIHIIADYYDMGVGGYWNLAANHEKAGKFIIQLDSDDVYADENTLSTMVNAFYEQNCAMVVGTYMMTDINLHMIAPGIIDHKEWTPENGRNNALRINGLGAPRAFYTPVLREVKVPNTSYGEDYALGLNISRNYQIGRVYKPVYLVRRWDDNSDADVDIVKMNTNNTYKDRIRTWELQARIAMNNK
jgi:glycosyltransferase involved in cell wall biosynthesis